MLPALLSRRLGQAVGSHVHTPDERTAIIRAIEQPGSDTLTFEDLPEAIRALVEDIESRPFL